jgi:hypothetical protein
MNQEEFKSLIRESAEEVIRENDSYDPKNLSAYFHKLDANIRNNTIIGSKWNKLVDGLQGVFDEVRDFEYMYRTQLSKEQNKPQTIIAKEKIEQIVKMLEEITPIVEQIHKVQMRDRVS